MWHSFPDREKEEKSRTEQRGKEGLYISPQLFLPGPSVHPSVGGGGGLSLDPKKAAVERLSEWDPFNPDGTALV